MSLYNDKPFRAGDTSHSYPCRPCQCYGHAISCIYNETLDSEPSRHEVGGGGQCVNCSDHTTGNQCDACVEGYFRPTGRSLYASDVCEPCNCSSNGVAHASNDSVHCEQVCCSSFQCSWNYNSKRELMNSANSSLVFLQQIFV